MWNPWALLTSPRAIGAILVVVALLGSHTFMYVKGKRTERLDWQAKEVAALEQAIIQRDAYNELVRQTILKYNKAIKSAKAGKDARDEQIPNVTDGRVCFASWDAVRLWNESISGSPDLPASTGGASNGAGTPTITDADLQRNINENGLRWKECRVKLQQIKELQDKWFRPK